MINKKDTTYWAWKAKGYRVKEMLYNDDTGKHEGWLFSKQILANDGYHIIGDDEHTVYKTI